MAWWHHRILIIQQAHDIRLQTRMLWSTAKTLLSFWKTKQTKQVGAYLHSWKTVVLRAMNRTSAAFTFISCSVILKQEEKHLSISKQYCSCQKRQINLFNLCNKLHCRDLYWSHNKSGMFWSFFFVTYRQINSEYKKTCFHCKHEG